MGYFRAIIYALLAISVSTITTNAAGVRPGQIKNLVTFGDSYTDVVNVGDGGVAWPVYAARYAHLDLFPFARSGATCSNNLTFRPFPPVFESQLPDYFSQKQSLRLTPQETIYTLWIGTNDVGANALLTGSDAASIVDVSACMVNWVKVLYESGARNFLFQNMIPLQTVPMYSPNSYPNKFWTDVRNTTEWTVLMTELVLSGNAITRLMLEALAPTLHGAHIGLFDSHALFTDMFNRPSLYLNGTAPLNVTGAVNTCVFELHGTTSDCVLVSGSARDSFLWFDELHPSEQADRIVAREVAASIQGKKNRWTTWLS
ncbi:GDSL lipase/acylhydrolase [Collybia nuda]|uniref:GDSL lipase/acylhydrolase n=1 Tax=Collybia nuda TaxID=64659 RepID=A0A9P5YCP9_9AGAR|nr:GDSL lipase/acylhydrolase [Collybia nuda]